MTQQQTAINGACHKYTQPSMYNVPIIGLTICVVNKGRPVTLKYFCILIKIIESTDDLYIINMFT